MTTASMTDLQSESEARFKQLVRWQSDWMANRDSLPKAARDALMMAGASENEAVALEVDLRNSIVLCEEAAERALHDIRALIGHMEAVSKLAAELRRRRVAAGGFIIN